jgi:dolichol-phosphate mannosyltransferase
MASAAAARAEVSIAVLARNEEQTIGAVLRDILARVRMPFEVIVVDDSTDATPRIVQELSAVDPRVRLVGQCGKGYTAAFAAAVRHARGEALVVLVADASDNTEDIERMRQRIDDGWDLVCASRYSPGGAALCAPSLQSICSRLVSRSLRALLCLPTSDVSNSFKMYRTLLLRSMELRDAGYATSMQVALRSWLRGDRITEIPTVWRGRSAGSSKFFLLRQASHYVYWYLWAIGRGVVRRGTRRDRT